MNILTSRKVLSKRPPQNPFTAMSSLAPSAVLEVALVRASPVSGCRLGSIITSWHTSVSTEAVTSRISLWWMVGKPPLGQERTCSTVKEFPQAQSMGIRDGVHPYLSANASVNALLCRQKPNSSMGKDVSQFEAPLSLASSIALLLVLDREGFRFSAACAACWRLCWRTVDFAVSWSA